jgi:hypothetical protein
MPDGKVVVTLKLPAGVVEALHDEASHRRVSPSAVADVLLRSGLPVLAQERVRDSVKGRGAA